MHRRRFLEITAGLGLGLVATPSLAAIPTPTGERTLKLYNTHTGEQLTANYWVDGQYIPEEITALNRILRDHRTGDVTVMDPGLFDLLYKLQYIVDAPKNELHIISGYRSMKTNRMLARNSNGVARRSLHTRGKAIDIRMPGTELHNLRKAALSLRAGGVGYYQRSNFIHVDTGRVRRW